MEKYFSKGHAEIFLAREKYPSLYNQSCKSYNVKYHG